MPYASNPPYLHQSSGGGYHSHQTNHAANTMAYPSHHHQQQQQAYPQPQQPQQPQQQSMTIDEMRILHRTALAEAEAKRTELRLVLASRYRELVGSSDEVIHMKERAEELHDLVVHLPELVEKVVQCAEREEEERGKKGAERRTSDGDGGSGEWRLVESREGHGEDEILRIRRELARLPREIHRCLDENHVHGAAAALISLFSVIASRSDRYPLATALSASNGGGNSNGANANNPPLLETQMKMVYLHVQTLPARTVKLATKILHRSAAKKGGAHVTAAALSALDLLDVAKGNDGNINSMNRANKLIDLYYESKAKLLNKLLNRLTLPSSISTAADAISVTNAAEKILSKIVLILQYDVILYPYMIFLLRKFPINENVADKSGSGSSNSSQNPNKITDKQQILHSIMSTLPPQFDGAVLQSKSSRFLAAHLPLIRTKVTTVLQIIAGTTASKLGQIRQSLYDKTDGIECMKELDGSGVCTWEEALTGMVDVRVVTHGTFASAGDGGGGGGGGGTTGVADANDTRSATQHSPSGAATQSPSSSRRFSLWGALFSNTFSSLVHSLLTSSFHSVHSRVVSTLRTSLARAPPAEFMLPHEAHRNALRIATDLDASLRRVSDDAHELLVHAEEREESERRLRQSLYVQTCEIMGRLLNELRRMLLVAGGTKERKDGSSRREFGNGEDEDEGDSGAGGEDATKVLIVGRLCHLLKFRLKTLPTLLDPKSSPAVLAAGLGGGKSTGMITLMELSSSFDLADDDDDGLISFDEAMEAMESAFSGTHFHGAEMVRDTLLLASSSSSVDGDTSRGVPSGNATFGANAHDKSAPQNVTLSELALLSARGLRHDASGPESALGTVQSSLDDIVSRCFKEWARAALSIPLKSFRTSLHERLEVACTVSDLEWRRLNGLIEKEDDALLREINESKGDLTKLKRRPVVVGQVSPHIVSYILAMSAVLNRSVCPADSLPPVPSMEYAKALGISFGDDEDIPNMLSTIRGSLLGEAVTTLSHSLHQVILESAEDDNGGNGDEHEKLKKCSPSSLVQLLLDVKFVHRCFFERNQYGFLFTNTDFETGKTSDEESRGIVEELSKKLSIYVKSSVTDEYSITSAIADRHSQVFVSCDLFLSSLFGEDEDGSFTASSSSTSMNGGSSMLSSSPHFILNPLASSRRFNLLPIQAEKSLTELQLRGKYGKKSQEEKAANIAPASGNALGSGFGFLSSMLTKTR
ncbi:hypothetical protein ACHAXS_010373 [Conticribra weissflogii]